MRFRFNINGDLWNDMLDHFALVSFDYLKEEDTWVALARNYRKHRKHDFTEYKMDVDGQFKTVQKLDGREPLVLSNYTRRNKIGPQTYALPKAPKTPDFKWHKGMTAKEWEEANGMPLPIKVKKDDSI